jgi:hypothetical protein
MIPYRGSKGSPGLVASRINNLWERDMKIIAKSGPNLFLAQLTTKEIDLLAGKQVGEGVGGYYRNEDREIRFGTTVNIVGAFVQIHRNNQRKREVESLRATLNAMLVGLDMIEPLIEEPKPEEASAE